IAHRDGCRAGTRGEVLFGGKGGDGGAWGGGVEQHRHGGGTTVRNGQIELAITIHIAHRDGYRAVASGEVLFGGKGGDGGARGGGVEQHRHGAGRIVHDGQIELAIPIHIAHRDGWRAEASGEVLFGGEAGYGGAWGGGVEQHRHRGVTN